MGSKWLVMGSAGVGKSQFIHHVLTSAGTSQLASTSTTYNTSTLQRADCTLVLDGAVCSVAIWEAPGHEYEIVPPLFNRDGHRQRQRPGGLDTRGACGFIVL